METVERSITIDAPLEKVFEYMDHPPHQAGITPGIAEVRDVERLPNGGSRSEYVYRMFGVRFRGGVEATEYEPGERIVFGLRGGIVGGIRWTFRPRNGKTDVTYAADYTVPVPVVGNFLARLAAGYNGRQIEATLANLKERLEAGSPG